MKPEWGHQQIKLGTIKAMAAGHLPGIHITEQHQDLVQNTYWCGQMYAACPRHKSDDAVGFCTEAGFEFKIQTHNSNYGMGVHNRTVGCASQHCHTLVSIRTRSRE